MAGKAIGITIILEELAPRAIGITVILEELAPRAIGITIILEELAPRAVGITIKFWPLVVNIKATLLYKLSSIQDALPYYTIDLTTQGTYKLPYYRSDHITTQGPSRYTNIMCQYSLKTAKSKKITKLTKITANLQLSHTKHN